MRAVTGDHIIFNECLSVFRPEILEINESCEPLTGYLLLDFQLNFPMVFDYFSIEPSIVVGLPGSYRAFISPVKLPRWFEFAWNAHLFTIGLAAVVSFVTGRPVKAPRDDYHTDFRDISEEALLELSLQFPVLTEGPGRHEVLLTNSRQEQIYSNLSDFIYRLYISPYKTYISTMQALRLTQLSYLNHREDFGLSYYLMISSIETLATTAIKSNKVEQRHAKYEYWKSKSKNDSDFKELFQEYTKEKDKNKSIKKKFIEFIMTYCPVSEWSDLEHPMGILAELVGEHLGGFSEHLLQKSIDEVYPDELSEIEIRVILGQMYNHRSNFTHRGENPPHRDSQSINRYFDKVNVIKGEHSELSVKKVILPTYRLVSFLSNRSIINYLNEKIKL